MVPRKVGAAWEVQAPAKLNLYLEVLGRRTDGFHELETLMVPVQIFDDLRWSPTTSDCTLSIRSQLAPGAELSTTDNLVLRAAKMLAQRAGIVPHGQFDLTKRIPIQAGLGGGSSNAAAALRLANAAWDTQLTDGELTEIATHLGSDVPFFLAGGPAICRGRGEQVEPVSDLPRLNLVVVKPSFGMSTPEIFRGLGESEAPTASRSARSTTQMSQLLTALRSGSVFQACQWMINRLESVATQLTPEISRIKGPLAQAGCWGQFMTGSGSTVVGVARSAIQARRIARVLSARNFGTVLAAASAW